MEKEIIPEDREDPIPGEYGHPIPLEIFYRELGINGPIRNRIGRRILSPTLATKAVHSMCTKPEFNRRSFKLPTGARTTFHMAFSSDGARVASCHGDHNVYVCDVATGKIIQTLTGHPRTPWCVVFHPTQNDILASGCLAGHIRVWDLKGGSEVLVTDSGTVIASLAFHPTVRLLAIATFNEIIFWDWGLSHPLARCSTQNTKEKVRLVRFDRLGQNLITGITNFPNPPTRESCAKATQSSTGPSFRPNFQPRSSWAGCMRHGYANHSSFYAYPRRPRSEQDDRTTDAGRNSTQSHAMDVSAAQSGSEVANSVDALTNRQERFQESYRQLVHHYQDLVSNYQQFLRSRIPRLLESTGAVREPRYLLPQIELNSNDFDQSPESSSDNSLDGTATVSLNISPNPVIVPELAPGTDSSDLDPLPEQIVIDEDISGSVQLPELAELDDGVIAHIDVDTHETPDIEISVANTVELPATDTAIVTDGANSATSETGLQNIEALAQNIIEMQNLCSRARRDAPLAVENQHIHELQNIRRHLEVLQDQTRELQSSIRATLSSLAHGSMEVLNARAITSEPSSEMPSQPVGNTNIETPRANPGPSRMVLRDNIYPRITLTSNTESFDTFPLPSTPPHEVGRVSPPSPFVTTNSSTAARTRVPPVQMQYDDINSDGSVGSRDTSSINSNASEPVPGPSRHHYYSSYRTNGNGDTTSVHNLQRRLVREFQVVHGGRFPGEQEHARNCPFSSRDNLMRPPTRMRCLTEMGESPALTVWPSPEPDQHYPIRRPRRSSVTNGESESSRSTERNTADGNNPFSSPYLPSFGQWLNNGPNWVNNAIGVGVFLAARQANQGSETSSSTIQLNESLENIDDEEWQRSFISGLGLIPPNIREGQRQQYRRVRRGQNIIYHLSQGQGRVFTLRPSQWDEFRSNFLSPNSQTEFNLPWNSSYDSQRPVELPPTMNGGFLRSFSMRSGDDVVPVYIHINGSHDPYAHLAHGDIRDSPIPNVYTFPIGLFLEGNSFTGGPQTIGIYWPPTSLEEEESLREFRRSEELVPVHMESPSSAPIACRIEYDQHRLVIWVDANRSLVIVQPGLMVLDAVTSVATWTRPRPVAGTVFISHLSPLLDALERLFGHRMRRGSPPSPVNLSSSSSSATPQPPSNPTTTGGIRMNTVTQPTLLGARTGAGRSISWVPLAGGEAGSHSSHRVERMLSPDIVDGPRLSRDGSYPGSQRQTDRERAARTNPRRLISFASSDVPMAEQPSPGPRNADALEAYRRRLYRDFIGPEIPDVVMNVNGEPVPPSLTHFISFSRSRSRSRPTARDYEPTGSRTSSSTRRFIRFAVDTATAEVLRRHPNASSQDAMTLNQSVQRAIESRIERVLNERGNRGAPSSQAPTSSSESASTSTSTSAQSNDTETESSRTGTNRSTSTSGTQTMQSFIRTATSPVSTSSVGVGTGPNSELHVDIMRIRQSSRRRAYPRVTREDNGAAEDDLAPPLPPRIARLNNDSGFGDPRNGSENETFQNSDVSGNIVDAEDQAHLISVMPAADVRVARRHRSSPFTYMSANPRVVASRNQLEHGGVRTDSFGARGNGESSSSRLADLGGPNPQLRTPNSSGISTSEPTNGRQGTSGSREPMPSTSGAGTSAIPRRLPTRLLNREDFVPNNAPDPAARFYPGYIPEILITPRVRPVNYYTMDAATTAFLSSRIQKWDFSTFAIPDITRRNESIVVAECSLHSDACLDISNDSEFLAVLQPSDNGSYSAVGIYSLREESLGDTLYVYHFDQNTVSISISPSCDYIVVGYAGRGPFYRFAHPSRNIGQILSLTRDRNGVKLVPVKELYAESQNSLMSINCMHFVPVPGYGIIYGTNTGELVLIS